MIRHLVLCGLGPGHLRLLADLARQGFQNHADIGISLLTRQHRYIADAALLKMVGTRRPADHRTTDERLARKTSAEAERLEAMVQKSGVRWIDNTPQALDLARKTLLLDDGRTLRFDWLSVEPEPVQHRDLMEHTLPGARANGLFVRPREAFCKLWPQVQSLAATRPLRFAVVLNANPGLRAAQSLETPAIAAMAHAGDAVEIAEIAESSESAEVTQPASLEAPDDPARPASSPSTPPSATPPVPPSATPSAPPSAPGFTASAESSRPAAPDWLSEKWALELAFALRHAFQGSAVTLITGGAAVGELLSPGFQKCLQSALRKRQITVLPDAALAIEPGEISLQSGARLACDVPLLALAPHTPDWLLTSGLLLNPQGQVQIDRNRCTGNPAIFVDTQNPATDGRRLFQSLRSVIKGRPLAAADLLPTASQTTATPIAPSRPFPDALTQNTIHRMDCGGGQSMLAWRNWAIESRRLWPNPW